MMFLLISRAWANHFIDALIPICIVVVLPVLIVWLVLRSRQHEVDRKAEIMLKALDNGAEINPDLFRPASNKTVKDKLMGRLTTACITGGIGLTVGIAGTVIMSIAGLFYEDDASLTLFLYIPCAILLAIGIAFFISYFVGRKLWVHELAALDEQQPADRQ